MAEHRFYAEGTVPPVSTYQFHKDRERAPHLEQEMHSRRLEFAARTIRAVYPATVVDLGCGDGGLLSLLPSRIEAWGYDFQPSNVEGWRERGVTAELKDVLYPGADIRWGDVVVMTEVLEHIHDPHGVLAWAAKHAKWVVASSPVGETPEHHADEHAWGWDIEGYAKLFDTHWDVIDHQVIDWCQILLGRSRHVE